MTHANLCSLVDVFRYRFSDLVCGQFIVKWTEIPLGVLLATDIPGELSLNEFLRCWRLLLSAQGRSWD